MSMQTDFDVIVVGVGASGTPAPKYFRRSDRDPPIFFSFVFGLLIIGNDRSEDLRFFCAPSHVVSPQNASLRFAYRPFGKAGGLPLVFNQHYAGTME
jgi:hypothetical protein